MRPSVGVCVEVCVCVCVVVWVHVDRKSTELVGGMLKKKGCEVGSRLISSSLLYV